MLLLHTHSEAEFEAKDEVRMLRAQIVLVVSNPIKKVSLFSSPNLC